MKKILLFITPFLLLTACGKKAEEKKDELLVKTEDLTVKLNEEILNTKGITELENGTITTEEQNIDTSKLGEQTITITIKDNEDNEKEYTFKVNVIDDEPPVITFKKELSTTVGTKIDLLKNVSAKDNSGEKIKVTVNGSYDIKKEGTYKLEYIAKDSSGNEATESFTLTVKKAPTPTETTTFRTSGTDSSLNGTKTSKGYTITVKNGITYIDGYLIANKTYSLPSTYSPGLNSNVKSKADEMFADAKKDGYNLYIASGFRSYDTQKKLYNNYVKRDGKKAADTYSARPGASEHQSGLAFDVCDRNVGACINSNFDSTAQAKWLSENAYKYGFILRYPKGKTDKTGYKYESWHFRYVGVELATKLYNGGNWITLEEYFGITSEYDY